MKRVRVVVSGRVQGVFFRATCERLARREGLAGSVRNRPDGSVEAVFEGPDEAVDRLVAWCRRGPDHAHVDGVRTASERPAGETDFRVTG